MVNKFVKIHTANYLKLKYRLALKERRRKGIVVMIDAVENQDLKQFERQQFINLETFKRSGQGVKTPVWFVENGGRLYVRTLASSWKVRRIRNNAGVRVAPCMAQGEPLGEWLPARARIITDPALEQQVNQLMDQKYGLQKKMVEAVGKLRKTRYAAIEIEV